MSTWEVPTPSGVARVHLHPVVHGRPRATLVLGHGVGRGVDSPDLVAIAEALPSDGVEVVLVEQPWRVRGQRLGGPAPTLDAAWIACLIDIRSRGIGSRRLVAGGRSTGARVACRTIDEVRPDALLAIAFPMWPARRGVGVADSRLPELVAAARAVPTVVVQGARDGLGAPDEIAVGLAAAGVTVRVVPVAWADHIWSVGAKAPGGRKAALAMVVRVARATALKLVDGPY